MATSTTLTHPSGVTKEAFVGWSWTTFIFGIWVPLLRGDIKWFAIMLVVNLLNYMLIGVGIGIITTLVWWFVSSAKYNEWHRTDLLLKGFK